MKFWEENRRLVKGLIAAAVLFGVAKLVVIRRYESMTEKVETERSDVRVELEPFHSNDMGVQPISYAMQSCREANGGLEKEKQHLKKRLQTAFPDWTKIPEKRNPAEYFRTQHSKVRLNCNTLCAGRVNLEDPDLGFELSSRLDKESAQENLRRLSIVERLVRLLVDARAHTIGSVKHDEPKLTGAWLREKNPDYKPSSKVASLRQKYIIRKYPEFIREYPTRIELIADIDPLMKFLHSVRKEHQFLVIRSLDIQSAAGMRDSDDRILPSGMLQVVITAAGMSFLSDEEVEQFEEKMPKAAKPKRRGPVKQETGPVRPRGA